MAQINKRVVIHFFAFSIAEFPVVINIKPFDYVRAEKSVKIPR